MDYETKKSKCFFCQTNSQFYHQTDCDYYICPLCGEYQISGNLRSELSDSGVCDNPPQYRAKIAMLLAERNLQKKGSVFLATYSDPKREMVDYKELITDFPQDFRQRHDRALLNIARQANYSPLQVLNKTNVNQFLLFCFSKKERDKLLKILKQENMLDFNMLASDESFLFDNLYLSSTGFEYVRKIESDKAQQKQAFIAMWFSDTMDAYTEAVKKAVRKAGYEAYIANRDSYNGLIMAKVMNKIVESRFVIADLTSLPEQDLSTGVRGGVYFEAGFATGLKKEVILTCREDVKDRIHFDLKQFFSVYWHEENQSLKAWNFDFVEYLTNHIIKSVGIGPLSVAKEQDSRDA